LTKLKQSGTIEDYITAFEQLDFFTEGMLDTFFHECFISGLKEDIHAHILMAHLRRGLKPLTEPRKHNRWSLNTSFIPCPHPTNLSLPYPVLNIRKLIRSKIVKQQIRGICYNCDEKYFMGEKFKDQKIFMAIYEEIFEYDGDSCYIPKFLYTCIHGLGPLTFRFFQRTIEKIFLKKQFL
jgi:hypothetical protein